jgi:hypothetical protein
VNFNDQRGRQSLQHAGALLDVMGRALAAPGCLVCYFLKAAKEVMSVFAGEQWRNLQHRYDRWR